MAEKESSNGFWNVNVVIAKSFHTMRMRARSLRQLSVEISEGALDQVPAIVRNGFKKLLNCNRNTCRSQASAAETTWPERDYFLGLRI